MEFLTVGVMHLLLVLAGAATTVLCYDVSFVYYPNDLGFGYCSTYCSISQNCTGNEGCQISSATTNPALVLIPFGTGNNRDAAVRYMRDEKVQLWDSISGVTASLSTFFVIRLSQVSGYATGDGLTFLIAPDPLTPDSSQGGSLGLFQSDDNGAPLHGDSRIVALKFDTHNNSKYNDPPAPYLGLDINSLVSSVHTRLDEDLLGQVEFLNSKYGVWMEYNGTTQVVVVSILLWPEGGGFGAAMALRPHAAHVFTYLLDLKSRVEEYSYVGFSAGTGHDFEINEVFYWEFETTGLGAAPPGPSGLSRALKLALLVAGGLLLALLLLCCCLCCLWRRHRRKQKQAQAVLPSVLLGNALPGAARKDDRPGAAVAITVFGAPNQEKARKKRQAGVVRALKHAAHKPPGEKAQRATNKKHGAHLPPRPLGDTAVRPTNKKPNALKPPPGAKETELTVTKMEKPKPESHRSPGAFGDRAMRDTKMHKSGAPAGLHDTALGKKHGPQRPESSSGQTEAGVTSKATPEAQWSHGAIGDRALRDTKLQKQGAKKAPTGLGNTAAVATSKDTGTTRVSKTRREDLYHAFPPTSSMPKHASTSGAASPSTSGASSLPKAATSKPHVEPVLRPPFPLPSHPDHASSVPSSAHSVSRYPPPPSDAGSSSSLPPPSDAGPALYTPSARSSSAHPTSRSPPPPSDAESPPSLAMHAPSARSPSTHAGSKFLPPPSIAGSSRSLPLPSDLGSSPNPPSQVYSAGSSSAHSASMSSPSDAEYPHPNPASHALLARSPSSHAGSKSHPPPSYPGSSKTLPPPSTSMFSQNLASQQAPSAGSSSAHAVSRSLSGSEFPHPNPASHAPSPSALAESMSLLPPSYVRFSRSLPPPPDAGSSQNLPSHPPSPSAGLSSVSRSPSPSEVESPHANLSSRAPSTRSPSAHAESISPPPPSYAGSSRSLPPPSDAGSSQSLTSHAPSAGSSSAHVVTRSPLPPSDTESSYSNPSSHSPSASLSSTNAGLRSLPPHLDAGPSQNPLARPPSADEVPRSSKPMTSLAPGGRPASSHALPTTDAHALFLSPTSMEAAPSTGPPPNAKPMPAPIHPEHWSSPASNVEPESPAPIVPANLAHSSHKTKLMTPSTSSFASAHTHTAHKPHAKPSHPPSSERPIELSTHREANTPLATSSLPYASAHSASKFHLSPHGGQRPATVSMPPSSAHSAPGILPSPHAEFRSPPALAAPSIPSSYVLSALKVPSSSGAELRPPGHLLPPSSASPGHKDTSQHGPKTEKFKKSILHHIGRQRKGLVLGTTNKNKPQRDFLQKTRKTVLQLLGLQKKIVLTKPPIKYKHWIPPGPTT